MKIVIFILVVVVALTGGLFIPRLIPIKKISCVSQYGPCSESIVKDLQVVESLAQTKNTLAKRLKNNPQVMQFSQRFVLPSELVVNVIERKPILALKNEGMEEFVLIDSQGVDLGKVSQTSLPTILLKEESELDLKFASKLMVKLGVMYAVNQAEADSEMLKVNINAFEVIFPLNGDSDLLLGSLSAVLSRMDGISQTSFDIIDLRFNNPVLR